MGAVNYSSPASFEDMVVPEVVNVAAAEEVAEVTEEVVPTEV